MLLSNRLLTNRPLFFTKVLKKAFSPAEKAFFIIY